MNLFQLAKDNGQYLEEQVIATKNTLAAREADILQQFATTVDQRGRASINMRQTTLLSFLVFGRYENMYEWAGSRAAHSSMSPESIMRDRMKDFYASRMFFDSQFEGSHRFHYGALNIGGLGAAIYGDFCVVLKDNAYDQAQVAYLRADSLRTYVKPGPALDDHGLKRDIAPHPHRQALATLKHSREVLASPSERWPTILCHDSEYVEVIFAGDVTREAIETVRMDRADYDLYFELAFEDFRSRLSDADRYRVDTFTMILTILENHNVPLEVVSHA